MIDDKTAYHRNELRESFTSCKGICFLLLGHFFLKTKTKGAKSWCIFFDPSHKNISYRGRLLCLHNVSLSVSLVDIAEETRLNKCKISD